MCKCVCSIVPPNVLNGLSKKGNESAKIALADLKSIELKREMILSNITKKEIIESNGSRFIYSSENSWELRKTLLRKENESPISNHEANFVYEIGGFMRNYFREKFGYNSLDNHGMDLIFNLNYRNDYNNAFWDGDEMAFGDGDGKNFLSFANSIDVIIHELTHGITQFTSNLRYYGQSGALNEHFSDVFGTILKQKFNNQNVEEADWLIGNDCIGPEFPGIALRSMKDPGTANEFDYQPNHMANYYYGEDDNQGVHINSGIPNKAFYLASMQLGCEITGMIWFETLLKLWATTNFNDFLEIILETTQELIKANKVPEKSIDSIGTAFEEVGLSNPKSQIQYEIEITGGIYGNKKTLKGDIKNEKLVSKLKNANLEDALNKNLRDGQTFSVKLKSQNFEKNFVADETSLNSELRLLIQEAYKNENIK